MCGKTGKTRFNEYCLWYVLVMEMIASDDCSQTSRGVFSFRSFGTTLSVKLAVLLTNGRRRLSRQ